MASSSSSSKQYVRVESGEEYQYTYTYPYPSNLSPASFISVKLSGRDKYQIWKTQMVCLLKSHGMFGFIDGTLGSPAQTSATSVSIFVSGKEKAVDTHGTTGELLWERSDALVKGWILGSLSEETFRRVLNLLAGKPHQQQLTDGDFSAKDVWDELQTMYGPPKLPTAAYGPVALQQQDEHYDKLEEDKRRAEFQQHLYQAVLSGSDLLIDSALSDGEVTVIDKITNNGNTALHVAVGVTGETELLEQLLNWTPETTHLVDVRNSDGSTLLHVAAIVGNTAAVDILVKRNPDLLFAKDNEGHTPLAIALSNMHTHTARHLLKQIEDIDNLLRRTLFFSTSGDDILVTAISSKDFSLARDLLHLQRGTIRLKSDAVLMAIALNFPRELNMLEEFTWNAFTSWELEISFRCRYLFKRISVICWIIKVLVLTIETALYWPFFKERLQTHNNASMLVESVCRMIKYLNDPICYHQYYMNPLSEAIRQNTYTVVENILSFFPDALLSANEEGHNMIQYAVINRSENIYNILYQMSEHKNIYRTIKDPSRNNLLHLAARLAPSTKLNLISGAALQIQRELQWFKEVERFACPLNIGQKNSSDETPQMVFTREHKELVIEGEKWMKATAESYTITAALIITIVFAAAITVPGGNNQDTGAPIFTNTTVFTIFAISDAISLFAAVTSLLTFLSVLTTRFAEQDFLYKLPTKLIIGLVTLFISTTSMIVAFAATLYIVFGQRNSKILIPIAVLTCLPITSFVTLQLPLVIELMSATYGRSIFGKRRKHLFQ